jgi:hypothetical protein
MCGSDYESILNTHKKVDNKKEYIEDLDRQKEFTKAMEGPGGYMVDKRTSKINLKSVS